MCEMQRSAHTTSLTEADGVNLDNIGGGGLFSFIQITFYMIACCIINEGIMVEK